MTPEDTPRMAERTDRQAQIDPWAQYDELKGMPWNSGLGILQSVASARAADAALLRERDAQIASLTAFRDAVASALCVENPFGEINDAAIIEAADTTLSQLFEFSAELVTLRAERDAAQQERDRLKEQMQFFADAKPETWDDPADFRLWVQSRARYLLAPFSSSPRPQEP